MLSQFSPASLSLSFSLSKRIFFHTNNSFSPFLSPSSISSYRCFGSKSRWLAKKRLTAAAGETPNSPSTTPPAYQKRKSNEKPASPAAAASQPIPGVQPISDSKASTKPTVWVNKPRKPRKNDKLAQAVSPSSPSATSPSQYKFRNSELIGPNESETFPAAAELEERYHSTEPVDSDLLTQLAIERRSFYKTEIRPLRHLCRSVPTDSHPPVELTRALERILKARRYKTLGDQATVKRLNYPLWHLANRTPAEFAVSRRVLMETLKRLPALNQSSGLDILDFGSSVGANIWSLMEILPKTKIKSYMAIEPSPGLQELARELLSFLPPETLTAMNFLHRAKIPDGDEKMYDLIVLSSSLILTPHDRRRALLGSLWKKLNAGGAIVIIEDGSEEGFRVVRQGRQSLLDQFGPRNASVEEESVAQIVAPCGHDGTCPMSNPGEICKFAHRLMFASLPQSSPIKHQYSKSATKHAAPATGGIVFKDFSYCVITKGEVRSPKPEILVSLETAIGKAGDTFVMKPLTKRGEKSSLKSDYKGNQLMRMNQIHENNTNNGNDISINQFEEQQNNDEMETMENNEENDDELDEEEDDEEEISDSYELDDLLDSSLPRGSITVPSSLYSQRYSRLITPPLRRGKHVIIDVCGTDGKLKRWVVPKSAGLEGGYAFTKKLKWGDLMPFEFNKGLKKKNKKIKIEENNENIKNGENENKMDNENKEEINKNDKKSNKKDNNNNESNTTTTTTTTAADNDKNGKNNNLSNREAISRRLLAVTGNPMINKKQLNQINELKLSKQENYQHKLTKRHGESDGINAEYQLNEARNQLNELELNKIQYDQLMKRKQLELEAKKMAEMEPIKSYQGEKLQEYEEKEQMEEFIEEEKQNIKLGIKSMNKNHHINPIISKSDKVFKQFNLDQKDNINIAKKKK